MNMQAASGALVCPTSASRSLLTDLRRLWRRVIGVLGPVNVPGVRAEDTQLIEDQPVNGVPLFAVQRPGWGRFPVVGHVSPFPCMDDRPLKIGMAECAGLPNPRATGAPSSSDGPGSADTQGLTGLQAFTRRREQQRQVGVGVRGADVVDLHDLAVVLDHDLDRDSTRGGPHPTHEPRTHQPRLPTHY